jgi:hypothetical protein
MFIAKVEVYSVATNKVVLRVPPRRYPGILIQGDDLSGLAGVANEACSLLLARFRTVQPNPKELEGMMALRNLQNELRSLLKHYNRASARAMKSPPDTPN